MRTKLIRILYEVENEFKEYYDSVLRKERPHIDDEARIIERLLSNAPRPGSFIRKTEIHKIK